ncbi:DivIVA domain-containing protein [Mesorhizobium loti]|uniref:DivIVA domain-containing protein n=1 Tax=Rhizobium loti TaxID=381 RepID=UPI001FD9667D|nr:DivIVA domain-containing protein [Mesorhizobium loti]
MPRGDGAGFQAIVDCMLEVGWTRGEVLRSLKRLIAADNMTQKENAKVEAELAIARAMIRAGRML